jgi:hypothetical protein
MDAPAFILTMAEVKLLGIASVRLPFSTYVIIRSLTLAIGGASFLDGSSASSVMRVVVVVLRDCLIWIMSDRVS